MSVLLQCGPNIMPVCPCLVLEFEMRRCWMKQIYRAHSVSLSVCEVAGLISYSFEVIAQIWLDLLRDFWGHWKTFIKSFFHKIHSFLLCWPSEDDFWPLTASITSEVKNNYNHVTMEGILNKISEIKLSVGCMVWPWCRLFQILRSCLLLIRCTLI